MNLREAYLYINENKLKDFIEKRCNRITSIKFMLENTVYCEVLSDNPYCIDMLFGSINDLGDLERHINEFINNDIIVEKITYDFKYCSAFIEYREVQEVLEGL